MSFQLLSDFSNSGIFIMDGLRDEDFQTARRLYEDLPTFTGYAETPTIQYKKVVTREDVFAFLKEIKQYCVAGGCPILHLEVHGDRASGLYIGNDGENITWSELATAFREINITCRNNLGVVLAGCHGINAITEIDALRPTPFHFLVGREGTIESGELEETVAKFYQKLFEGCMLSDAMAAVDGKLITFLAEREFIIAMVKYLREKARGRGKKRRVESIVSKWIATNPSHTKRRLRQFRSRVKTMLKPSVEEICRNADNFLIGNYSLNAEELLAFLSTLNGPGKSRG